MLWYKSWLETRSRFLIGLALLCCSAAGVVLVWPKIMELMPLAASINVSGVLGRQIRESAEMSREYRGYIWSQWFRQNLVQLGTLFAVALGTGGLLSQRSEGLFTLSLPVSRARLTMVRAAAGLAELCALAFVPSLLIPLLSPAVGKSYQPADAAIQSACMFLGAAVFFSMAFLLSTVFHDLWRPLLIAFTLAVVLGVSEEVFPDWSRYSIFHVMRAESYFRSGELPWQGLFASIAASAAMLYGAVRNVARRDF